MKMPPVPGTGRILLVDDQPPFADSLRRLFGPALEVCASVNELTKAIYEGRTWDAAFVDFDLTGASDGPQPTGLSALRLLKRTRPDTRRIVYTTLSENGRTLFAVSAYHWLGVRVILDKHSGKDAIRAAVINGVNPTAGGWTDKLKAAGFVDGLFATEQWSSIWQLWPQHNGAFRVVSRHTTLHSTNSLLTFSNEAPRAAEAYRNQFESSRPPIVTEGFQKAASLLAFISEHDKFFNAIDLKHVLGDVKPWSK